MSEEGRLSDRKHKITFVVPTACYTPSRGWDKAAVAPLEGATLAATLLQKAGYKVQCFDLRLDADQKTLAVRSASESVAVCIAGAPDSYRFIREFCTELKSYNEQIPIILGGPLSTFGWDTILCKTKVNYCLVGECERVIVKLVECVLQGKMPINFPVAFVHAGKVIAPTRSPKVCMSEVPYPDYTLWKESYGSHYPPSLLYYSTQRGCRGKCSFCALPGRWRPSEESKIASDLTKIRELGVKKLFFSDPTFNTETKHCLAVASVIKEQIRLPWACHIRAKPSSRSFFEVLKKSGCEALFLGIESAEEAILRQYNKGTSLKDIESCLASASDVGLPVWGFLILGLPGETKQSLRKTIEFTANHAFAPRATFATPFPGSVLHHIFLEDAIKEGARKEDVVERILEQVSDLRYDGTDEPMQLPGREIGLVPILRETMAWMTQMAVERVGQLP